MSKSKASTLKHWQNKQFSLLKEHLFPDLKNAIISTVLLTLIAYITLKFSDWAVIKATWTATSGTQCSQQGACWAFVTNRLDQFIYGFYPVASRWRVNIVFLHFLLCLSSYYWPLQVKKKFQTYLILTFPFLSYILLNGGFWGLSKVETSLWGGAFLSILISSIGIFFSLPIGIGLALGRRSSMTAIRSSSILFIELWRGVPLISVLFMSSVMFPILLPPGFEVNKLLRAIIAVTLFSSAYMAEVVRGGLQSLDLGQYEAAEALGLSYVQKMRYIILPQALGRMIPGIMNTFIGLFKDTTLVGIIGMFDLLGMIQAASTDPKWLGYSLEGYLFAAAFYGISCYIMAIVGQRLELKNNGQ